MMAASGAAPEHVASETCLKLVRVKRKRDAQAPDDLVVEGLEVPGKRAHTSLSSALEGLGLAQEDQEPLDAADDSAQAPADDTDADQPAAQPAARRQRFRRLSTLSAAQLRSIDQQQLASLLAAQQEQAAQARRAAVKSGGGEAAAAAAAAAAAGRAAQQLQAGQAARYDQVRRRRGITPASAAERSTDPLQQLASVYDLVQREAGDAESAPAQQAPVQQAQRRPSRAQRAAQQYDEGTLMCNYMPMIREYLASQGRELPEDSAGGSTAAAHAAQQAQQGGGQPGASGGQAAVQGQDSDGDEYVYDLYAVVDDEEEEGGREAEEQWWELHARGAAPVVQIVDDDTWLVIEQPDAEDSGADSEDSNAEGFYAHDYPDEDSDADSSDDGYDPEGSTFHPGGGRGRLQHRSWDEASHGNGSEGSDAY